jgi:hypothetical protein
MPRDQEDVIRVHGVPRSDDGAPTRTERLTQVGAVNVRLEGTYVRRAVPAPWVDCDACDRRHYPSTIGGRWHIATTCLSCGAALPG